MEATPPPHFEAHQEKERDIVYTGLFVEDIQALVEQFPPKHPCVYAHHLTIAYRPDSLGSITPGKKRVVKIVGRAFDKKGDVLLVECADSEKVYPHITLSCAQGVEPDYSNTLLEQAIATGTLECFAEPIELELTEGWWDGSDSTAKYTE